MTNTAQHDVELGRHGVNLNAQARTGFIDQIDGLIGQEAIGDVTVTHRGGRHESRVLNANTVVHFVLFFEPAEDGNGVFHRGLTDEYLLEASLEGRVLLDVLAVLVQGGGADES